MHTHLSSIPNTTLQRPCRIPNSFYESTLRHDGSYHWRVVVNKSEDSGTSADGRGT